MNVADEILVSVYYDPFCTMLSETWKLFVHTAHRLDTLPVFYDPQSQSNLASILIRDNLPSRMVSPWTTSGNQQILFPQKIQSLSAACLNEIKLQICPTTLAESFHIVNVTDVERKTLVSSWIVKVHPQAPEATKEFEIDLPRTRTVHKVCSGS